MIELFGIRIRSAPVWNLEQSWVRSGFGADIRLIFLHQKRIRILIFFAENWMRNGAGFEYF